MHISRARIKLSEPEILLGVFFAAGYSLISIFRYRGMLAGVDLALYTEAVKGYSEGRAPLSTIKTVSDFNLLGDHFTPAVAILVPMYWLAPHSWVLLIGQGLLIGLSVGIITKASAETFGRWVGCILGFSYAVSWGIQGLVNFDFHEVALALPLIAMCYIKLMHGQHRSALVWALPLMLVKEDSVFLLLGVVLVLLARREWKLAAALSMLSGSFFALTVGVIIPWLSYYGRYTYWAATSATTDSSAIVKIWGHAFDSFRSGDFPTLVLVLAGPVLGLCLRSPLILGVLPVLCSRFMSPNPVYWALSFHYNATIAVIVALAAVDGLRRMRNHGLSAYLRNMILVGVMTSSILVAAVGPMSESIAYTRVDCPTCDQVRALLQEIPNGAAVAADDTLAPYLVDRTRVYGLHEGLLDSSGQSIPASWIVIDMHRSTAAELAWAWKVSREPGVTVWGRVTSEQDRDRVPLDVMLLKDSRAVTSGVSFGATACPQAVSP